MVNSDARARPLRRDNAPIRKRKPATTVPDFLFSLAAAAWTMAVVFVIASFADDDVTAGEPGTILARMFAAALALSGVFGFLLGLILLRDERRQRDHYITPMILGVIMGGLVAALFLIPANTFVLAPFLLLVFVYRPLRKRIARLAARAAP
jgi:hypothetical protein